MKKALSILLTFLIITSVFVMNIGTVSAASPVTSVNVTGVKPPVAGEHPDYSDIKLETVPPNAAEIVEMHWVGKNYNRLDNDYTFVEGEKYIIFFTIRPKSGYCFEFGECYRYTGEAAISDFTVRSAISCASPNQDKLFLECNWVEAEEYTPTAITSVKVTGVKQPVEGEHPDYSDIKLTTVPENAAEIENMNWHSVNYGPLSENDTFVADKDYYISFVLKPKSGYCFELNEYSNYIGKVEIEGFIVHFAEESPLGDPGTLFLDCKTVKAEKYVPQELTDSQFLMYADEVYGMTDRGIMLTGRVLNGRVNKGDTIMVTYYDGTNAVTEEMPAEAIYMYGKNLDYAEKGDYIGILIGMPYGTNEDGSINRGKISTGAVLQGTKNTIPPVTEMVGTIKMLSTEEGGRTTPIEEGFRPQAYVGTSDVTCTFLDLNGGAIQPGETRTNVKLGDFYHGVVVYRGQEILIQQAGRTVGTFTVGETTAITSVKITGVKPPVAGEHPNYSGIKLTTVPPNAAEIVDAQWLTMNDQPLSEDDAFSVKNIYYLCLNIRPKSCYYFEFDEYNDYNIYNGEAAVEGYDLWYTRIEQGSLCIACDSIVLCGDVDMNGTINILDVTLIQKYLAELVTLTDEQISYADVNFDNKVNILDVTEIQKYLAQLIDGFVFKHPMG